MDEKDILKRYGSCLYNIRNRILVICDHLNGKTNENYSIVETEFLCLQIRKILEEIAFLSLVANKEKYCEIRKEYTKDYHANNIIREIEKINPSFYPTPVKQKKAKDGVYELVDIQDGFLTKKEFFKIYKKCGSMLHSFNPYAYPKDEKAILKNVKDWTRRIFLLINHHMIHMYDTKYTIIGILFPSNSEYPHASIFKKIEELEKVI